MFTLWSWEGSTWRAGRKCVSIAAVVYSAFSHRAMCRALQGQLESPTPAVYRLASHSASCGHACLPAHSFSSLSGYLWFISDSAAVAHFTALPFLFPLPEALLNMTHETSQAKGDPYIPFRGHRVSCPRSSNGFLMRCFLCDVIFQKSRKYRHCLASL